MWGNVCLQGKLISDLPVSYGGFIEVPHINSTQYLPMSCSDPLTNVRGIVCIKSLSWVLKPMSLLHCLLLTILLKRTIPAPQPMCSSSSCNSSSVPLSTEFTGHRYVQSTILISFLYGCHGRSEGLSSWEVMSHPSPESQGHLEI